MILSPLGAGFAVLRDVREHLPALPVVAWAPFRADDGEALAACREGGVAALVVEGVDDAVAGELVSRATLAAERRRLLGDGPRVLRLTEPLQLRAWELVVRDVEEPLRTEQIAARLRVSREHLSRQFGAGGAPNLKRVIDLARVACAAQLLQNPRTPAPVAAEILRYASASHLAATVRRIADVAVQDLADLGPQGVLVRVRSRADPQPVVTTRRTSPAEPVAGLPSLARPRFCDYFHKLFPNRFLNRLSSESHGL